MIKIFLILALLISTSWKLIPNILAPASVASTPHGVGDKPSVVGVIYFMKKWQEQILKSGEHARSNGPITSIHKKTWVKIHPFEYKICNDGSLRSMDRVVEITGAGSRHERGQIIKPIMSGNGYFRVILFIKGVRHAIGFHRLLALVFVSNPDNKPQVNHINGIKTDNRIENLEWVSPSDNIKHAWKMGLNVVTENRRRATTLNAKLKCKKVDQFTMGGDFIQSFNSLTLAAAHVGVPVTLICANINGRQKSSAGYVWRFSK